MNKAVFLDRDGVINFEHGDYTYDRTDFEIKIGDSFNKIVRSIGDPIETKSRKINEDTYQMSTYVINNTNYRLFFENNILFDIEKY